MIYENYYKEAQDEAIDGDPEKAFEILGVKRKKSDTFNNIVFQKTLDDFNKKNQKRISEGKKPVKVNVTGEKVLTKN